MTNKRIIIKLGTSTLTHPGGSLNLHKMDKIARAVADIRGMGNEVIIVTSAAISAGTAKLGLKERPKELRAKMAVSAIGQAQLMHIYDTIFADYNCTVAQILLTDANVERESSADNLSSTFNTLLEMGVIPIVNENDSVASTEIESGHHKILGDNDTLSAIVAGLTHADLLILLSDIDGLYSSDPRTDPEARLLTEVREITPEILAMAGGTGSVHGTGGMVTKLSAASIANAAGCDMIITNSDNIDHLYDIMEGKQVGTRFIASRNHEVDHE
ncbi:MAG: glutamate 5-kinase [Lachnospiraceae bacterium]|nr:glutamate 5-kinase [Lachnospiraceae bacterium]